MPRHAAVFLLASLAGCSSSSSTTQEQVKGPDAEVDTGAANQGDSQVSDGQPTSDDGSISPADALTSTCSLPQPPNPLPDGGVCTTLVANGPLVQESCSDASVPMAQGGVIEDGTYVLESATYYGVCPMPQNITRDQVTWVVCGSNWQSSQLIGTIAPATYGVTVSPGDASTSLSFELTCSSPSPPPKMPLLYGYDAPPGHLTLLTPPFGAGLGTIEVDSYVRQ